MVNIYKTIEGISIHIDLGRSIGIPVKLIVWLPSTVLLTYIPITSKNTNPNIR
jgi:hypothetical protein